MGRQPAALNLAPQYGEIAYELGYGDEHLYVRSDDLTNLPKVGQRVWSFGCVGSPADPRISSKSGARSESPILTSLCAKQEDVIKALEHAKIAAGPGGPAEMVPGQHHVRMNMYIAQANNGNFRIVKSLGVIDPKECMQGIK